MAEQNQQQQSKGEQKRSYVCKFNVAIANPAREGKQAHELPHLETLIHVAPGGRVNLTDAEAKHLLKQGAIHPFQS